MKQLLIIVPKGSLIDSYLMKSFRVYARLSETENMVYYKDIGFSTSMETISHLTTMFMLSDFSVNCKHGDYILRVRSCV